MPTNEEIRRRIDQHHASGVPLPCEQPWHEPTDWDWSYYNQLKGATVLSVGFEQDGSPVLVFRIPDASYRKGSKIRVTQISQDPEGNGAGFLFGLDNPNDTGGEERRTS